MIKRYSFQTEKKAQELILTLGLEPNQTTSKDISGIVLDVRPLPKYDEDNEVIEVEHLTYDVDVVWRNEEGDGWGDFKVTPKTPNHKFM